MSTERPYLIGLTGGIGSGKSTVAEGFAARGITVVDADLIAHQLSAPGGLAIDALRAAFGDPYITPAGALDRVRMRRLAFEADQARARLEGILHPLIRSESERQVRASPSPYTLLVIPLLFESPSWRERVDRALVVDCPPALQIERVMQRSKLTREEVAAIMARQVDRATRLELADEVIDNSGAPEALEAQIETLHRDYLQKLASQRL